MAIPTSRTGPTRYQLTQLKKFVMENGFGQSIIQVDKEPAILQLAQEAVKELTIPWRHSSSHTHQGQGPIERLHKTLYAQVRAIKFDLVDRYNLQTPDNVSEALLPWMLQHTCFTINRHPVHTDGMTKYERRCGLSVEYNATQQFAALAKWFWPTSSQSQSTSLSSGTMSSRLKYGWARQPTVVSTSLPQRTIRKGLLHKKRDKVDDNGTGRSTTAFTSHKWTRPCRRTILKKSTSARHSSMSSSQEQGRTTNNQDTVFGSTIRTQRHLPPDQQQTTQQPQFQLTVHLHLVLNHHTQEQSIYTYIHPTPKTAAQPDNYKPAHRLTSKQPPAIMAQLEDISLMKEITLENNEDKDEKTKMETNVKDIKVQPWWQYEDDITMFSEMVVRDAMNKELSQLLSKRSFKEIDSRTLTHEQRQQVMATRWVITPGPSNNATPSSMAMRLLLTIAIAKQFTIFTTNVASAFLNTPINEEVLVQPPKEYTTTINHTSCGR
eukprot:2633531-Amphidinium_carterae.2